MSDYARIRLHSIGDMRARSHLIIREDRSSPRLELITACGRSLSISRWYRAELLESYSISCAICAKSSELDEWRAVRYMFRAESRLEESSEESSCGCEARSAPAGRCERGSPLPCSR